LFFEGGDFFTRADEQVAVEGKLVFVANGAVPWDDDHFVRNFSRLASVARIMPSMLPPVE
jgi:hypothetical protein